MDHLKASCLKPPKNVFCLTKGFSLTKVLNEYYLTTDWEPVSPQHYLTAVVIGTHQIQIPLQQHFKNGFKLVYIYSIAILHELLCYIQLKLCIEMIGKVSLR